MLFFSRSLIGCLEDKEEEKERKEKEEEKERKEKEEEKEEENTIQEKWGGCVVL